eukprot:TRINITY_DN1585_c0_g1_i1.p3 TRINITY_DN1585_c0_g1~~TRINITY_DN1585_c0_g1_i1.p3  ORF type:complete len:149 (-),score=25.02 TRINITY_DN1585_c0_g1_i1:174-620(-)
MLSCMTYTQISKSCNPSRKSHVVAMAEVKKGGFSLSKLEQLKLLSQVEKSGLLSKLEKSGLTLSKIEEAGLLSKAEEVGALSALESESTPAALNAIGLLLLVGAAATVYFVSDDSSANVAIQAVAVVIGGFGGIAALYGASFISSLQK